MIQSRPIESRLIQYGDVTVHFRDDLDGGGSLFGNDVVPFVRETLGKVGRVYEWCSGPAFIGFSLLAEGVCESLCLADVNPDVVAMLRKTVDANALHDRVSVYHSDCLDNIPASERWDLVVGNPPHSGTDDELLHWGRPLVYQDPGWALHKRLFDSVGTHLNPNGGLILLETYFGSNADTFAPLLENTGLHIRSVSPLPWPPYQSLYYLWLERTVDLPRAATNGHDPSSARMHFYYDNPKDRDIERNFLDHAGFGRRPVLRSPDHIFEHRRDMLHADPSTRAKLERSTVTVVLTGPHGGRWRIEHVAGQTIVQKDPAASLPTGATISMTATQFVDLYDRRMKFLYAYLNGHLTVTGDVRLAQAVLRTLLAHR